MVSHDNDASESSQPSCGKACTLELSVQLPREVVYTWYGVVDLCWVSTSPSMVSMKYSASVRRIVADFLHIPPNGYSSKPNDMKQLHGLLDSIISDMDKVFISYFWQSLFKVLEVQLKLSSAYHPQTNGQTEAREQALNMLKFRLKRAQDRMRNLANKNRSDRVFEVGMWVYLNLQPHRQVTIRQGQQNKLSSNYAREAQTKWEFCPTVDLMACCLLSNCSFRPRSSSFNNRVAVYVLVKWSNHTDEDSNHTDEDATWELYSDLIHRFPKEKS
ncbi:retrotransposable element Tf2 [Tanacetum coccineum]